MFNPESLIGGEFIAMGELHLYRLGPNLIVDDKILKTTVQYWCDRYVSGSIEREELEEHLHEIIVEKEGTVHVSNGE